MENKEFYSTGEVARLLKISRIAVFNKIKGGKLPAIKVGKNYVIRREDLAAIFGEAILREEPEAVEKEPEEAKNRASLL